jgi:hypothetical protein
VGSSFSFELEEVIYITKEMTGIRGQPVLAKKKRKKHNSKKQQQQPSGSCKTYPKLLLNLII